MLAIYVRDTHCTPYSSALVSGYKKIETRTKNVFKSMLSDYEKKSVLVIKTTNWGKSYIVGSINLGQPQKITDRETWDSLFLQHGVPSGSMFDFKGLKWCYPVSGAVKFSAPVPLSNYKVINHGRSWCEVFPSSAD